jgi:hypothetical protein
VHLIAFAQQEFGKVRAVLPGDAGDESFFHQSCSPGTRYFQHV